LKVFAACANFVALAPSRKPSDSALGFTLVCHSEECSDEESAFDFPFLVQRIGKSAKQMLHFIQHDTTANSNVPKDSGFLGVLSAFAREIQLLVAPLPR
jgi:hypothetical protein